MRAFFADSDAIKRDEIAARQLLALKQHYRGKLRIFDVKTMSLQTKDHLRRLVYQAGLQGRWIHDLPVKRTFLG